MYELDRVCTQTQSFAYHSAVDANIVTCEHPGYYQGHAHTSICFADSGLLLYMGLGAFVHIALALHMRAIATHRRTRRFHYHDEASAMGSHTPADFYP